MTLLEQTSGTWANVATVAVGSFIGLSLRHSLSERYTSIATQSLGLLTLFLGILNANELTRVEDPPGLIVGMLGLLFGSLLGVALRLEARLEDLAGWLKTKTNSGDERFMDGFVAASLLFCAGPLTIVGSIDNGLRGDATLILLKAGMDGFASAALAASFGVGVAFSVLTVVVVQGGISLSAGLVSSAIPDPSTDPNIALVSGVGGIIMLGLALRLLDVKSIPVANMLPGIVLVLPFYHLGRLL
ncbi:MAG: DUF554 domain-containing protein [Myxococcota bacterium]